MKKFFLLALILMGISSVVSAQIQVIYTQDISDGTTVFYPHYYIDRTAKKLYFYDPTGPDAQENAQAYPENNIQSIKKSGNTETIIFTQPNYPVEYKLVLVINPKLTSKDDLSGQSATVTMNPGGEMEKKKCLLYDQLPDEEKESIEYQRKYMEQEAAREKGKISSKGGNSGSNNNESQKPADKLLNKGKDGVKNLLNKGKGLLKKK